MEESINSMEGGLNSQLLPFDSPKEIPSYIKVIGVGGGGGNAVNNMYNQGIKGVDFIVCNTDMKALNNSPVPNKIILGQLGAGNKPEVAREAALKHKEEIREVLESNTQMLFITAGMGGGTGTGAAPVVAEIAKSIELDDNDVKRILVVAVVTMPFSFEGKKRREQAEHGIEELRKHVDSILIINNDNLKLMGNGMILTQAFRKADDVLFTAVKGIAEIITVDGYVNIDFHDVNTVMQNSGTALMGAGIGSGENRAMDAVVMASTSVLLNDNHIEGAKNMLLYFSYPSDNEITMDELFVITNYLSELTGRDQSDVIWGSGTDDTLTDELKITLIATGFEQSKPKEGNLIQLEEKKSEVEEKKSGKVIPLIDGEVVERSVATPAAPVSAAPAVVMMAPKVVEAAVEAPVPQAPEAVVAQPAAPVAPAQVEHMAKPAETETISAPAFAPESFAPAPTATEKMPGKRYLLLEDEVQTASDSDSHTEYGGDPMQDELQLRHIEPEPLPSDLAPEMVAVEVPSALSTASVQAFDVVDVQPSSEATVEVSATVVERVSAAAQPQEVARPVVASMPSMEARVANLEPSPNDVEALKRAEKMKRIRALNNLLHNHANGAQQVAALTTSQLTDEVIPQTVPSSQSDLRTMRVDRQGNFVQGNNYVNAKVD